jgi:hypothetical protein
MSRREIKQGEVKHGLVNEGLLTEQNANRRHHRHFPPFIPTPSYRYFEKKKKGYADT